MGTKELAPRPTTEQPNAATASEAAAPAEGIAASPAAQAAGHDDDELPPAAVYSPDDDAPMRPIHEDADDDEDGAAKKKLAAAEEAEEEEPREDERTIRRKLPGFNNAQELLLNELPARASYADAKLRGNLVGSIVVHLKDTDERFLFDWTTDQLRTGKAENGAGDCTIRLNSQNLMRIANGDLNPQVGMLSDKVMIEGRAGLAIYFFNLVAPRVQH